MYTVPWTLGSGSFFASAGLARTRPGPVDSCRPLPVHGWIARKPQMAACRTGARPAALSSRIIPATAPAALPVARIGSATKQSFGASRCQAELGNEERGNGHLLALPASERCPGFFRCWTRKEAYIKAHGAGLSLPLKDFDVSLSPGEQDALLATRPNGDEAALWSIRDIGAGEGYEAALCVKGQGWILRS